MFYDWKYLAVTLLCLLLSTYAGAKVRTAYAKYDRVRCGSGMTGYDAAAALLRSNGLTDISLGRVGGLLTDHYHPVKGVVNLSEATYGSNSVAAVAVAAHEVGHVLQKRQGYLPYRLRTAIVPVVNFGSRLAVPLVLLGLLLGGAAAGMPGRGYGLAVTGVVLYGLSVLFALVTLPVEYNASRRAKQMLLAERILPEEQLPAAEAVLSAAAMTYLASLLVSLLYFLRFAWMVHAVFGRRSGRR